jgi:hypothetical protein
MNQKLVVLILFLLERCANSTAAIEQLASCLDFEQLIDNWLTSDSVSTSFIQGHCWTFSLQDSIANVLDTGQHKDTAIQ